MRTLLLSTFLVACGGGEQPAPKPAEHHEEPAPAPKAEPAPAPAKPDFASMNEEEQHKFLMEEGKNVYENSTLACKTCHGDEGKGQQGVFPPLVGQKDHMGDCAKHAGIVLWGLQGKLTVDGVDYDSAMTPQHAMLDDLQIAAVISYERHSWGNDYGWCSPDDVKKVRDAGDPNAAH
ncbi:MAG: cytochrome c [Alphaproteobacteria bacterium]|nr:cytochrome c [Alphaproteobacteria bacterium]